MRDSPRRGSRRRRVVTRRPGCWPRSPGCGGVRPAGVGARHMRTATQSPHGAPLGTHPAAQPCLTAHRRASLAPGSWFNVEPRCPPHFGHASLASLQSRYFEYILRLHVRSSRTSPRLCKRLFPGVLGAVRTRLSGTGLFSHAESFNRTCAFFLKSNEW